MKKLILFLLLLAALAVAWLYWQPAEPTNAPAAVSNVVRPAPQVVQPDADAVVVEDDETGEESDDDADIDADTDSADDSEADDEETQEEEEVGEGEVFVPEQPLAEVDEDVTDSSAGEGTTYSLASNSRVEWRGTKVGGAHNGYVPVTEGVIKVNNGTITAGNFTLDMAGLDATDIDSDDLDGHLKGWFNTEEYPSATFDIVAVSATSVQGNLTMNGMTMTITFPATVIVEDDVVIANAEFSLDKSLWDVGGSPGVSEFMDISLSLTWTQ